MKQISAVAEVARALQASRHALIISHIIPDGDCIGSSLALGMGLSRKGISCHCVNGDQVPEMYRFLQGSEQFLLPGQVPEQLDTLVLVDCSDPERTGPVLQQMMHKGRLVINIDHHVSNTMFGHLNLVEPRAAAAGELIYRILQELGVEVDAPIATALYTALVTDTGSFQYQNTTAETLRLAAELVDRGAQLSAIAHHIWESKPLSAMLLLKKVLPTLELAAGGRVAWVVLPKKVMDEVGACSEHCEGLVNYPRSIKGVELALFFREMEPGTVKIGFRSKSYVDVNILASRFGGGGHRRAAGCVLEGQLDEVVDLVVSKAVAFLEEVAANA